MHAPKLNLLIEPLFLRASPVMVQLQLRYIKGGFFAIIVSLQKLV